MNFELRRWKIKARKRRVDNMWTIWPKWVQIDNTRLRKLPSWSSELYYYGSDDKTPISVRLSENKLDININHKGRIYLKDRRWTYPEFKAQLRETLKTYKLENL